MTLAKCSSKDAQGGGTSEVGGVLRKSPPTSNMHHFTFEVHRTFEVDRCMFEVEKSGKFEFLFRGGRSDNYKQVLWLFAKLILK